MKIHISNFENGSRIPFRNAFCVPESAKSSLDGNNINPHVSWSDFPEETQSFALICVDPDVPSVGHDVNKADRTVPHDLPRVDFYHWVIANIPLEVTEIPEGADSSKITVGGKKTGITGYGAISGLNDYTGYFANNEDMKGIYGGYDGPCPPWNDERLHHYHFKIFALNTDNLNLFDIFNGKELELAMEHHIIDQAEWIGVYTLNKDLIEND